MSYLRFYKKYADAGILPGKKGLCREFNPDKQNHLFFLIQPTRDDFTMISCEDKDWLFWGSDDWEELEGVFTPLRQNIVLLLACLNNEL